MNFNQSWIAEKLLLGRWSIFLLKCSGMSLIQIQLMFTASELFCMSCFTLFLHFGGKIRNKRLETSWKKKLYSKMKLESFRMRQRIWFLSCWTRIQGKGLKSRISCKTSSSQNIFIVTKSIKLREDLLRNLLLSGKKKLELLRVLGIKFRFIQMKRQKIVRQNLKLHKAQKLITR